MNKIFNEFISWACSRVGVGISKISLKASRPMDASGKFRSRQAMELRKNTWKKKESKNQSNPSQKTKNQKNSEDIEISGGPSDQPVTHRRTIQLVEMLGKNVSPLSRTWLVETLRSKPFRVLRVLCV